MAKYGSARSLLTDEYIVNKETRDMVSTLPSVDSLPFVFDAITLATIVLYTATFEAHDFAGEIQAKFGQAESTSDPPNYASMYDVVRT
jgi:hypothetical protein